MLKNATKDEVVTECTEGPNVPKWDGQNWMLTDKGYEIFKSVSQKEASNEKNEFSYGGTETPRSLGVNKRLILVDKEHQLNTFEANKYDGLLNNRNRFLNTPTSSLVEYPDIFQIVSNVTYIEFMLFDMLLCSL